MNDFVFEERRSKEDYLKILKESNYTSEQISKMSTSEMKTAIKNNVGKSSLDEKTKSKVISSLNAFKSEGYGDLTPSNANGKYSQGNSRWAKMPIGMLPDGSIATMERAGCGPTALAAVANTVADRSVGYGPITPGDIGAYAASNGYISQGGANAGLFTEGAAKMGLSSSPITDANELRNNLLAGKPTILTGKSNSATPTIKGPTTPRPINKFFVLFHCQKYFSHVINSIVDSVSFNK